MWLFFSTTDFFILTVCYSENLRTYVTTYELKNKLFTVNSHTIKQTIGMRLTLTLPAAIPDKKKKLTQIFIFTFLCGASKTFVKVLKALCILMLWLKNVKRRHLL